MKITIEIDDTLLAPAIQEHLETGKPVQEYIKSAMSFYQYAGDEIKAGNAIGVGEPTRLRQYHRVIDYHKF